MVATSGSMSSNPVEEVKAARRTFLAVSVVPKGTSDRASDIGRSDESGYDGDIGGTGGGGRDQSGSFWDQGAVMIVRGVGARNPQPEEGGGDEEGGGVA